jgi:flagellar biosynthesis anti-sigma factor FlgM
MTDPISGPSAKALSAIKPDPKKDVRPDKATESGRSVQAESTRPASDEVQLNESTVVELKRAEFDEAKVAQIKRSLAEGNYPIDPKKIAQGFTEIEKLL